MKDIYKFILLHSIKHKLGVDPLVDRGLTYLQISEFITELTESGLIDKKLNLTNHGSEVLQTMNKKFNENLTYKLIEPRNEQRIEKIGLYDVYLPERALPRN